MARAEAVSIIASSIRNPAKSRARFAVFCAGAWSDRRIGRPENALTGLSFTRGGYSRYGLGVPRASGGAAAPERSALIAETRTGG